MDNHNPVPPITILTCARERKYGMDCMASDELVPYSCCVNVVLLSTSKYRVQAIRAASRRKGFACTVVPDDEHASALIQRNSNEGILVLDAEATRDMDQILRARRPNWPILVLSSCFDSSAWVEMFKAGASEIIGDPLHARKVDAALEGFSGVKSTGPVGWWQAMVQRLGMR